MDDSGIDVQVSSHGAPSTQRMDASNGIPVAKATNDYLFEICQANPQRLAGFAASPTVDPTAAADELSRSVNELGFKGAMIHGLIGEEKLFVDNQQIWLIFEKAQALDVPIYIHPANPHPALLCCIQEMGVDRTLFAIDYPFVPNEPGPE